MKKIFFAAAVVAASAFGVMKATDVNNTKNMSELQLADVEALAQNGEAYEYHYYDKVPGDSWRGTATGQDGKDYPAKFQKWECPNGFTLDSCVPYTEVTIYD